MTDDRARALFKDAQALKKKGEPEQAVKLLEEARGLAPNALGVLAELGLIYRDLGREEEALECLETYIVQKPDSPAILFTLGNLLISCGNVERGVGLLEQAVKQDPNLVPALLALSPAKRSLMEDAHVEILTKTYHRKDLDDSVRSSICFALGMAHYKPGTEDIAFEYWNKANTYRYNALEDKTDSHVLSMKAMRQVFTQDSVARFSSSDNQSRLPIFVIGMPRSGTSLVEQILSSHS